jgi:sugar-specific transcriptional regulator TrmB
MSLVGSDESILKEIDLSVLGLTEVELKLYLQLVNSTEPLNATEIQNLCKISKPTVYSALKKLAKLHLISATDGTPRKYLASNPEILNRLRDEKIAEIKEKTEKLLTKVTELHERKKTFTCHGQSKEVIIGRRYTEKNMSLKKITELLDAAKDEIFLVDASIHLLKTLKSVLLKAKKRGVSLHLNTSDNIIIPKEWSALKKEFNIEHMSKAKPAFVVDGAKKYFSTQLIIDRRLFCSILEDENESEFIFEILSSPRCANCIINFFSGWYDHLKDQPKIDTSLPREAFLALQILRTEGPLSKRELGIKAGLSGTYVNKAIKFLEKEKMINLRKVANGRGKPREEISLIN